MSYLEKNFQTQFNRWCKYNFKKTAAFELKLGASNSIPFLALQEHQQNNLYNTKHNSLIYKIPDTGYQNPFDSLMLYNEPAFVVLKFNRNKDKKFYMIDIDDWIMEQDISIRKSITLERAQKIGIECELKKED